MPLKEQSNMALKQLKLSNFPNSLKRRSLISTNMFATGIKSIESVCVLWISYLAKMCFYCRIYSTAIMIYTQYDLKYYGCNGCKQIKLLDANACSKQK